MSILTDIKSPADVKKLSKAELDILAKEIRQRIIEVTSQNGGHIGPNLGVVELTIALHRIFNTPKDRFVFDVSHQGYVHKLLTGRNGEDFDLIRQTGGVSGFLNRNESEHDCYGAGHAGTALSAALGMATGRDLKNSDEHVVAIIGDAALTCGITMEALNNIASSTKKLVVILNDNEWSIDKNVGAISRYLNELITNPVYNRIDNDLKSVLQKLPGGESLLKLGSRARKETKDFIVQSCLFEKFDMRYIGPIDGHDLETVTRFLEFARDSDRPVLLHVLTKKGKGYDIAIKEPEKFHGTSPFNITTGKGSPSPTGTPPTYQDVFGRALVTYAREDEKLVGITAAMPSGTGLKYLRDELPRQYFDVGIAEEHAVLFAAGLATQGFKPVVAIYSTFLQRAYDPIIHDVCLQNLPVIFCMDRAGLSPNDGATHHGLFDISYLRCVPRVVLMQPKDEDELCDMLWTAKNYDGPTFIRYPRGNGEGIEIKIKPQNLEIGKAEILSEGHDITIWALGSWVADAQKLASELAKEGISVGVVNARFVKPLDVETLQKTAQSSRLIVTMEEGVVQGGFGSAVLEALNDMDIQIPVERIGWPDHFVDHATSLEDLREQNGLSPETILERVRVRFQNVASNVTVSPT